jgi:5-oxoprolinase (ATP-hydrolysing) subunit A
MMQAPLRIDLNCDMGEYSEAAVDGTQEALMLSVTSVNIACGGHAGDEGLMRATIEQAMRHGDAIGAHPGYADRKNFGRVELELSPGEVADSVYEQVVTLAKIAESCGARVAHVKPHGALYNQAARDRVLAGAIAAGVARWSTEAVMVGLAGSVMLAAFREAGLAVAAEAFADRRYEADGSLRSRKFPDAMISDPEKAAQQVVQIVKHGTVLAWDGTEISIDAQTICLHGDTLDAPQIAAVIGMKLRDAAIAVRALGSGVNLSLRG